MSSRYRVLVAESARQDLREIADYLIRRDSRAAARRQLSKLKKQIRGLATDPSGRRIVPELAERGLRTWREVIVSPWRIIYRVEGRAVYVVLVFDGRRDPAEILLRRLTRP